MRLPPSCTTILDEYSRTCTVSNTLETIGLHSRLNRHPFPLLALCDFLAHLFLVHFLLEELSCKLRIALTFDITKSGQVVADGVFLFTECVTEMFAEGNEGSSHDPVGDDLVVVGLEQEENDTRCEDKVPLLEKEG